MTWLRSWLYSLARSVGRWLGRMVEARSILTRDPNAVGDQQAFTPVATLKDFYARDTDPGAVGFESVWKDTSATPPTWWRRNATNDGWDAVVEITTIGVTDEDTIVVVRVTSAGTGKADADRLATATGSGDAFARSLTDAQGAGNADSSITAQVSGFGSVGNASARATATASDGGADVSATATSDGIAIAGSLAVRGAENAGMQAIVDGTSARMAFNGTTPIAKPAITGSRGGNAALASLLTQLAALGLITDSTS